MELVPQICFLMVCHCRSM
ncbi:hypothetical protein D4764_02G0006000 [Takifugu flavidus]|uniref:Uncharacterized protein n=1 Tax=Takifugu flavidus TaxID=433684 RepID=A0A5C6NLL8_9TELE|nr:hypothetical protein D4764_02G0006000 [Takifugu flavidus]